MTARTSLEKREVFHLLLLRELVRSLPASALVLKGGANLRFYFGSIRYSEDMDLDVEAIDVHLLQEKVMGVLNAQRFLDSLRTYGIEELRIPDLSRSRQTETVQRFKIGLLSTAGEDLATKVEFSRRGLEEDRHVEPVASEILAAYRLPQIIAAHYGARGAALQKLRAVFSRAHPQARDIFDLYLLSARPEVLNKALGRDLPGKSIQRAEETIYSIEYPQYRDTVVDFLGADDRPTYDSPEMWDEIRLRALALVEGQAPDDT